jgi:hypothetical protein
LTGSNRSSNRYSEYVTPAYVKSIMAEGPDEDTYREFASGLLNPRLSMVEDAATPRASLYVDTIDELDDGGRDSSNRRHTIMAGMDGDDTESAHFDSYDVTPRKAAQPDTITLDGFKTPREEDDVVSGYFGSYDVMGTVKRNAAVQDELTPQASPQCLPSSSFFVVVLIIYSTGQPRVADPKGYPAAPSPQAIGCHPRYAFTQVM